MSPFISDHKRRNPLNISIVKLQMVKDGSIEYGRWQISEPKDIAEIGFRILDKADREIFAVICLNMKNRINFIHIVSIGTLQSSLIHPREVFKAAVLSNSASIVLLHNHPSGNLEPSNEDIAVTKRLIEAGEILDIKVLDHVIVADNEFKSMQEGRICDFRQ